MFYKRTASPDSHRTAGVIYYTLGIPEQYPYARIVITNLGICLNSDLQCGVIVSRGNIV